MKVRLVEDGPSRYRTAAGTFEPGDAREVSDALGEHLLEKPVFVAAEAAGDTDADDAFDVAAFVDQNADPQIEAIEAGDVDEHLDAIAEANEYATVSDAIGVRRAELEA